MVKIKMLGVYQGWKYPNHLLLEGQVYNVPDDVADYLRTNFSSPRCEIVAEKQLAEKGDSFAISLKEEDPFEQRD